MGEVLGQTAPFGTPLRVLDLGAGGFAIESAVPFELNTEYTFQFYALDTRYGPIRARNVHCLRFSRDGAMICVAGFSFVLRTAAEQHAVNGLMAEAQDLYLHRHATA